MCWRLAYSIWPDLEEGLAKYNQRTEVGITRQEFKRIYGHVLAAIFCLKDGALIAEWYSESLSQFMGCTPEDNIIIANQKRLLHPDDWPRLKADECKILGEPGIHQGKYRIFPDDGRMHHILVASWCVRTEKDILVFRIYRDITGQEIIKEYINNKAAS